MVNPVNDATIVNYDSRVIEWPQISSHYDSRVINDDIVEMFLFHLMS